MPKQALRVNCSANYLFLRNLLFLDLGPTFLCNLRGADQSAPNFLARKFFPRRSIVFDRSSFGQAKASRSKLNYGVWSILFVCLYFVAFKVEAECVRRPMKSAKKAE